MSFLIEDPDKYLFQRERANKPFRQVSFGEQFRIEIDSAYLQEHLPKYNTPLNTQLLDISSSSESITIRYYISNIYRHISGLYTIYVSRKHLSLKFEMKLLNTRYQYLKIEGSQRNKLIFKYLGRKEIHRDFKIEIDLTKGLLVCSFPFFFIREDIELQKVTKTIDKILKEFTKILRLNSDLIENILQLSGQKYYEVRSLYDIKEQKSKFIQNYEYRKLMNIQLCFASQTKQNEAQLNERLRKEIDSVQRIKNGFFPTHKQFGSVAIYFHSCISNCNHVLQINEDDLRIRGEERDNIKSKNQLPRMQKDKGNEDNPYILNYVLINNLSPNIKTKLINKGGFTDIYLTEIIYWYIGSYWAGACSDLTSITSKTPVKKLVIIKREKKQILQVGYRSRVAHQKYILKQIKNGFSIFLCKYYTDDKCTQLQNDLISDYIDSPNFHEYCIRHRQSISIQTKIYFSLMITQSLRYLKEYKIVHLDLKPTNIMTNKRLTIKLIDFGESFHPDLTKNSKVTHQPGFSMPYSAPQNYVDQTFFSYKNDVFSLGVIMYQLFLGKVPFFFYSEQLRQKVYCQRNYLDYLFFCPQQHTIAGQGIAFPLIQAIILKCLHPDPIQRPQLQWIVYLLRQSLNYLY